MFANLEQLGATVVGVSTDSIESHKAFAENHQLPYPLLADEDGAIAAAFGVSTRGGYADRVTFVVAPDGTIGRVFPKVDISGHAEEVEAAVRSMVPGATPEATDGPATDAGSE